MVVTRDNMVLAPNENGSHRIRPGKIERRAVAAGAKAAARCGKCVRRGRDAALIEAMQYEERKWDTQPTAER